LAPSRRLLPAKTTPPPAAPFFFPNPIPNPAPDGSANLQFKALFQTLNLTQAAVVRDGGVQWVLRGREGGAGGEHLPRVPEAVSQPPPPPPEQPFFLDLSI